MFIVGPSSNPDLALGQMRPLPDVMGLAAAPISMTMSLPRRFAFPALQPPVPFTLAQPITSLTKALGPGLAQQVGLPFIASLAVIHLEPALAAELVGNMMLFNHEWLWAAWHASMRISWYIVDIAWPEQFSQMA